VPLYVGIDYGDRRIGVAISDPGGRMAFPRETIVHNGPMPKAVELVAQCIRRLEAQVVVVGIALSLDGSRGKQADRLASFAGMLRKMLGDTVTVRLADESLTTAEASWLLSEAGCRPKKQKDRIDQAAASVLLQSYLDSLPRQHTTDSEEGGVQ